MARIIRRDHLRTGALELVEAEKLLYLADFRVCHAPAPRRSRPELVTELVNQPSGALQNGITIERNAEAGW
jgi:hypothetical protein